MLRRVSNPTSEQMIEVNKRTFRISAVKEIEYVSDYRADREPEPPQLPLIPEQRASVDALLAYNRAILEDHGVLKGKHTDLRTKWKAEGFTQYTTCVRDVGRRSRRTFVNIAPANV